MQEIPTIIKLSGSLGRKFGREHKRVIFKTQDAINALSKTIPGFQQHMAESHKRGITYAIFRGGKNISQTELSFPNNNEPIHIVPVVIGSKRQGLLQTIFGLILVVVGVVLSIWGYGAGSPLMSMGASMMAGGITQMLSPQPKGLTDTSDPDNKPSYAFGSPKITTAQGYPVPVYYGRRLVGGAAISAAIYTEDSQ